MDSCVASSRCRLKSRVVSYVNVVREPVAHFVSIFYYFRLQSQYRERLFTAHEQNMVRKARVALICQVVVGERAWVTLSPCRQWTSACGGGTSRATRTWSTSPSPSRSSAGQRPRAGEQEQAPACFQKTRRETLFRVQRSPSQPPFCVHKIFCFFLPPPFNRSCMQGSLENGSLVLNPKCFLADSPQIHPPPT